MESIMYDKYSFCKDNFIFSAIVSNMLWIIIRKEIRFLEDVV